MMTRRYIPVTNICHEFSDLNRNLIRNVIKRTFGSVLLAKNQISLRICAVVIPTILHVYLAKYLGPVVQSIVSLTSSLVVKMLTVLVNTISNSQVFFFQQKC